MKTTRERTNATSTATSSLHQMKTRKCTASFKGKDGFGTCDSKCQWYRKGRNCVCSKMTKTTREEKTDLKKKLVKKLLAEGVQVTMSVAKALDEFIDVDVSDKIESLLEKEKEESFIKGIMAEDDVRDKIRLEMFIKEKTK